MNKTCIALSLFALAVIGCAKSAPTTGDGSPEAIAKMKTQLTEEEGEKLEEAIEHITGRYVKTIFGPSENDERRIREDVSEKTLDELIYEGVVAKLESDIDLEKELMYGSTGGMRMEHEAKILLLEEELRALTSKNQN